VPLQGFTALRALLVCGNWLLLPAAAEGLIELNKGEEFVSLCLRKIEFCGEVVGLVGENLEVAGYTTLIANVGKPRGTLGGGSEKFLLLSKFPEFAITDERVGNVAEGLLDGLLIGKNGYLLLGLGEPDARTNSASGEDGLSKRAGETP